MINLLKCPLSSVITLDHNFFLDLEWWSTFLPQWNGTSSFLSVNWLLPSVLHLYTDAAGSIGFGAFFNGAWFHGKWPDWIINQFSIAFLELVPIYLACHVWRLHFVDQKIMFHSDNQSICHAWENSSAAKPEIAHLMRQMMMVAAVNNFTLTIKHVRGVDNGIADALSRFEMERFVELAPFASRNPLPVPCLDHLRCLLPS